MVVLDLGPVSESLTGWVPGAHIAVHLPSGKVRQYSLCGDLGAHGIYRIAVLRVQGRGGSAEAHTLEVGNRLRISQPRNNFPMMPHDNYLFIAGGIGITPLLPVIAQARSRGLSWQLLYGGRTRSSMAFLDQIRGLDPARITIVPEDEHGLAGAMRNLARGTGVYACGPEPMLAAVEEHFSGSSATTLHTERFNKRPEFNPGLGAEYDSAFEVFLARSGRSVKVGSHQTALEAIRSVGLVVPSSCEEGYCGTCETRVLEGRVEHRDSLLSDAERRLDLSMMICVSRAKEGRIVLDL